MRPGSDSGRAPTVDSRRDFNGTVDVPSHGAPSIEPPPYPLDPPLEDVRIPVKPQHATATAYSQAERARAEAARRKVAELEEQFRRLRDGP